MDNRDNIASENPGDSRLSGPLWVAFQTWIWDSQHWLQLWMTSGGNKIGVLCLFLFSLTIYTHIYKWGVWVCRYVCIYNSERIIWYSFILGPDICGKYKKVVQLILNYKDDYYFIKKNITCEVWSMLFSELLIFNLACNF